MITKVFGIVINKKDYDETSVIVTIFSKELGKLSFYAPGVRKITSKNQFSLQFLSSSEFEIFLSYHSDKLSKLKTGNLIKERMNFTKSYENYLLAVLLCEVLEQASEVRKIDVKYYNLLEQTLDNLLFIEDNLTVMIYFLFRSLTWYGLEWNFTGCCRCDGKKDIITISFKDEGIICKSCLTVSDYRFDITIIKVIIHWMTNEQWTDDLQVHYLTRDVIMLFKMLCEYYHNIVGLFSYSIYEMRKKSIYFK